MDLDTLLAFVDTIIPAGQGVNPMPSAADTETFRTMSETEFATHWRARLVVLAQAADDRLGTTYSALDQGARTQLVRDLERAEPRVVQPLIMRTASLYYMDDQVMNLLGLDARPPFPVGNQVPETDWSILDAVIQRGGSWRPTD